MAEQKESPFVCHVFVCTNDRLGKKKSCADGDSPAVRKALKEEIGNRGWKGKVRVSQSGCLGLCAKGPNVMIHPQNIWFSAVSTDDVGLIVSKIASFLG
ncbi:MAG: (2Fe-2S) ferredoxin domain-containing protein [Deltaproteobacteria bacterium]|nr:(2Fe-2S) ferredoxin domain-containing protein [Deltaproteobacteria bacterium]